jgi:hypothetical protein
VVSCSEESNETSDSIKDAECHDRTYDCLLSLQELGSMQLPEC